MLKMTICQALWWATEKLKAKKIASADLDAEVILSYVLKKPREWILARYKKQDTPRPPSIRLKAGGSGRARYKKNPKFQSASWRTKPIPKSKLSKFKILILRRAKGVPVAYLTHHKEFYGLDFYVDERVLIPRPETEMLVDEAYSRLTTHITRRENSFTIVDVGTGSGCIAISLYKTLVASDQLPVTIYATDISTDALAVARKNAKKHDAKINFLQGDLLEPIIKRKIRPDIIIANLPYLKPNEIKGDIRFEPRQALDGGKDGLKYYEKLFEQIGLLRVSCYMLCEIDPCQTKKIIKLIKEYLPDAETKIKKDLAGLERIAITTNYPTHTPLLCHSERPQSK